MEKRATNGLSAKQTRGLVIDMAMKINSKQRERLASSMKDYPVLQGSVRLRPTAPRAVKSASRRGTIWQALTNTTLNATLNASNHSLSGKSCRGNVGTVCSPNLVCWGKLEEQVFSAESNGQAQQPSTGDTNGSGGQSQQPSTGDTNGSGGQAQQPSAGGSTGPAAAALTEALMWAESVTVTMIASTTISAVLQRRWSKKNKKLAAAAKQVKQAKRC